MSLSLIIIYVLLEGAKAKEVQGVSLSYTTKVLLGLAIIAAAVFIQVLLFSPLPPFAVLHDDLMFLMSKVNFYGIPDLSKLPPLVRPFFRLSYTLSISYPIE